MLHKTLTIQLTNSYFAMTDNEQYYICQVNMDIMKCLVSKGHYFSLSRGLYPVQGSNDCILVLYFNNDNAITTYCSITLNTVYKNSVTQLSPNHYLMSLIQYSSIQHRCPGYTNETINH